MAHTHDVYDMENHFEINGSSRFIKETSETKLVVVQGDHKSEVLTFKMPRYIDGHDMTLCNKIRIHYINLDTKTNNKSADVYEVTDLTLCEECEDVLTFTWTIEAPATKYSGTLSFLVKFECTEGENVLYQWNTAKYVSVNVLAGIDNSEEFVDKYSNVLEEWYNELTKGADSIEELNQQAIAEIELAKEDAKEDIQGKADATMAEMNQFSSNAYNSFKNDVDVKAKKTLESIPEDYSDLDAEVKTLKNTSVNRFEYTDEKNLSPMLTWKSGVIINQNNGEELTGQADVFVSTEQYIEVEPNNTYALIDNTMNVAHFFRGAEYDENKVFIRGFVSDYIYTSSNAKYIRFTTDTRVVDIVNPLNMGFGKKKDMEERVALGVYYMPKASIENFPGGIVATELDEKIEIPTSIKSDIASEITLFRSGILDFTGDNLLNMANLQLKKQFDKNGDGSIVNVNGSVGIVDTYLIIPNQVYSINTSIFCAIGWWIDEFGNPLENANLSANVKQYTAPIGAYGLRLNVNYSEHPTTPYDETVIVCKGEELKPVTPYRDAFVVMPKYLQAKGNHDWTSYRYIAIGDSRTAGYSSNLKDDGGNWIWDEDVSHTYAGFISYYTGIKLENRAVVGASFCQREGITHTTMYEQAQNIPSDTDIVTIFGMSNDRIIGVSHPNLNPTNERDNAEDLYDVTTFKGAIRQTIKNIRTQAPYAIIIFLTEIEEYETVDGGQNKREMIEEICLQHKIPTLCLSECAMTGTASDEYMEQKYHSYTDGLHESVFGQKLTARAVMGEMSKYLW